jgi:hypothetical protein
MLTFGAVVLGVTGPQRAAHFWFRGADGAFRSPFRGDPRARRHDRAYL